VDHHKIFLVSDLCLLKKKKKRKRKRKKRKRKKKSLSKRLKVLD
jgi:hypothetical protein